MKKAILFGAAVVFGLPLFAQMTPPTYNGGGDDGNKGFKKENIFIGGSIGLGYADDAFSVGGNPEIGYSLSKWLDAGVVVNVNYYSQQADPNLVYNDDIRTHQLTYGAGVFARIYPVNFLFVQLQPEQNWVHYNQTFFGNGQTTQSGTVQAFSFIAGVGYSRRLIGQFGSFFMIGLDLANNQYSPYRENGVAIPIVRGGVDFYLKSSKRRR